MKITKVQEPLETIKNKGINNLYNSKFYYNRSNKMKKKKYPEYIGAIIEFFASEIIGFLLIIALVVKIVCYIF